MEITILEEQKERTLTFDNFFYQDFLFVAQKFRVEFGDSISRILPFLTPY